MLQEDTASRPMLDDEVRGHVGDVLAIKTSNAQAVATIQRRVSGASNKQLFTAFVVLLREQAGRIAELEAVCDDLADQVDHLNDSVDELEAELEALRDKPAPDGGAA